MGASSQPRQRLSRQVRSKSNSKNPSEVAFNSGIDEINDMATYGHMKRKRQTRLTYPEAKAEKFAIEEAAAAYGIECAVVNVREAKDQLSSLLDRAAKGERIVVTSDGQPKAMIVRYRPIIRGAPWTSTRALREKYPTIMEDSTQFIRDERDSGY